MGRKPSGVMTAVHAQKATAAIRTIIAPRTIQTLGLETRIYSFNLSGDDSLSKEFFLKISFSIMCWNSVTRILQLVQAKNLLQGHTAWTVQTRAVFSSKPSSGDLIFCNIIAKRRSDCKRQVYFAEFHHQEGCYKTLKDIFDLIATRKLVEGGYRKKPFEMT